jgi:NADH-quinone oxidoreductase subunit H
MNLDLVWANVWGHTLVLGVLVLVGALTAAAYAVWWERKLIGRMHNRVGVNMLGPAGLFQPLADVFKLLVKEDLIPATADKTLFNLAPPLTVLCAFAGLAVVPLTNTLVVADLNVGLLFLLAVSSMTALPLWMAGWGSNNKYALLGAMRTVAQGIAYEIPLVLSALVPVVLAGSMSLMDIARVQAGGRWFLWYPVGPGLVAFVIFFMASLAEANRIPFDIPEAESELVSGVSTEYSGMKFGLFYLTEYMHTIVSALVASTLFMGGVDGPFVAGIHWLALKTFFLFSVMLWVRWTLLRLRSDQLMRLCWKYLIPISLLTLAASAVWVRFFPGGGA